MVAQWERNAPDATGKLCMDDLEITENQEPYDKAAAGIQMDTIEGHTKAGYGREPTQKRLMTLARNTQVSAQL